LEAIGDGVSDYWVERLQAAVVSTVNGIVADNAAAPSGTDTHVQGDAINDLSVLNGGAYLAGTTDFSAAAVVNTALTAGDSMDQFTTIFAHSTIVARMVKADLIETIRDSEGRAIIRRFMGKEVIMDDSLLPAGQVYDTWLVGPGFLQLGVKEMDPDQATEIERHAGSGNGGGGDTLYSRNEWVIHPVGHAYVGTAPNGGPATATTANNLGHAASWSRVWPERKQIKFALLRTREA
jgi:hypothetical protein